MVTETGPGQPPSRIGLVLLVLESTRPGQWVKNLFVLAPLVFAKYLDHPTDVARSLLAFVAFCAASGAVYLLNDIRDLEADRLHPDKKRRPLASGRLSVTAAGRAAAIVAALGLSFALALGRNVAATLVGYLILNLAYSLWLKKIPYLDAASIALGFLLRVLAGSAAVSVTPSSWLLACTALLAAYLALGKRAHELTTLGERAAEHRKVLARYRRSHVQTVMSVLGIATVVTYAIYTLSDRTRDFFGTDHLIYSSLFVAFGLFRFRALSLDDRRSVSPTEAMLRDWPFVFNILCWGASVVGIIYLLPR